MGESSTEKKGFVEGLKAEFKKIVWPNKTTLGKQTVAVTIISVILGLIIALLDTVIQYAINFITM
ncbi:MAG: preprotein translocase subunit SecE [Lachnospiraceae bacterium]|nr:preprotein translocase subunit SecE [Lachnospiraceae bacterium]